MMMTWYRIQDADRDPRALLDPANWISSTWNPEQKNCQCQGWDECEQCGGNGYYTEAPRRGVSVCRSLGELREYAEAAAMDLRDTVIIELDGEVSEHEDHDSGHGYGVDLIYPSAVVSVTPVAEVGEFAEQLAWDEANR